MHLKDFYEKVSNHEILEGAGVIEQCNQIGIPSVLITNRQNPALKTQIAIKTILETDWETIEAICLGKMEPTPLQHISRIVGYFSRIENWSKSKIGEFKDRNAGNYAIAV